MISKIKPGMSNGIEYVQENAQREEFLCNI